MSSSLDTTPPIIHESDPLVRNRYIQLLQQVLTFALWDGQDGVVWQPTGRDRMLQRRLQRRRITLVKMGRVDEREMGTGIPRLAHTMVGNRRLENLWYCAEKVLQCGVPGDFVETGVWRGGASIFLRGILAAYGITDRTVWVADSFQGLPEPEKDPADGDRPLHAFPELAISLEEVRKNFRCYGLLDDQVRFLPGWFRDTLPTAPIDKIAILRLDTDTYSSTTDALQALYPKLATGGFCVIDDYKADDTCRQAADNYRLANQITARIVPIDGTGVYWRK